MVLSFRKIQKLCLVIVLAVGLSTPAFIVSFAPRPAQAACVCVSPNMCNPIDCVLARQIVRGMHILGERIMLEFTETLFKRYRTWFATSFFNSRVGPDLKYFAQHMSDVAMQQAMIIGMFLDSKQQIETMRILNELQFQAHRDYKPSEDFCWFGTAVRSMHSTELRSRYHGMALNTAQMQRHLGHETLGSGVSRDMDKGARWQYFTFVYCDPKDNAWNSNPGTGLEGVCRNSAADPARINIDIDYPRLIGDARSVNIGIEPTAGRTDVLTLGHNLYGNNVLSQNFGAERLALGDYGRLYMALRSVAARRNVAQNSYNSIVELKTFGSSDIAGSSSISHTRNFLAAILVELGVPADQVFQYIGSRPSYYAQLEILAKKIYQNPDFYANLYDTPANVARKGVALKAIELMLDRAIYESELRQEMLSSVLLSTSVYDEMRNVGEIFGGGAVQ